MGRGQPSRDGAETRVVDARRQAARTLAVAVVFALAAPVALLAPNDTGTWLPLHLLLVGALLSAISGATQLLAVTWSAAPAPVDALAAAQRWLLAAGTVSVAAGRETRSDALVIVGGAALLAAFALLGCSLVQIRRRSGTDRFHPAIDAYLSAVGWAFVGLALGVVVAVITPSLWWIRLRAAHPAVSLYGIVGLVIIGTLPFFVATQARTRMATAATPAAARRLIVGLDLAVAMTAVGHVFGWSALSSVGYGSYAVGIVVMLRSLPAIGTRQLRWAGPRLVQLAAGLAWWIITTGLLAAAELTSGIDRSRVLAALAVGGFAQILVASLAYLGPVLRGGGHRALSAGFSTTASLVSLAAANVAAGAVLAGAGTVATAALVVWGADLAVRTLRLLAGRRASVPRGQDGVTPGRDRDSRHG